MKQLIPILLFLFLAASCSPPGTVEQVHRHQDGCRRHWLVVRMTGPMPDLVAITMLLGGKDEMSHTAMVTQEHFLTSEERIVTIRIRVHSPEEVGQVLCLLHRYPVHILSMEAI